MSDPHEFDPLLDASPESPVVEPAAPAPRAPEDERESGVEDSKPPVAAESPKAAPAVVPADRVADLLAKAEAARRAAEEARQAHEAALIGAREVERQLEAAQCPPTLQELNAAAQKLDAPAALERAEMASRLADLNLRLQRKPHPLLFKP